MVFSSYVFLFFFLPSLIVIYFLSPPKWKNIVLLVYSLVFYAWNVPSYLLLLVCSIAVNWMAGVLIHKYESVPKAAKMVLTGAIVVNCLILGYFKYSNFFIQNLNVLLYKEIPLLNVTLPIGISFYTFQGLSYVIDVYRKDGRYQKNPLNVALYISLFPQLVAGPIVRYDSIAQQLDCRNNSIEKTSYGLQRFTFGLAKKIILADTFGIIADYAFEANYLTAGLAWMGAISYTLQIYFDFSGYSDMAIGLGRIFGFDFCENFNYPYISKSITEFWRRWHISLSTWFRDYIYIPLGGNRVSAGRHIFNMLVVWFATGLWHGASWNFVLWGLYYFVWLLLEKYVFPKIPLHLPSFIKWIYTILVIVVGWVLFRAQNLDSAVKYLKTMFGTGIFTTESIQEFLRFALNYKYFFILGVVFSTPIFRKIYAILERKFDASVLYGMIKYGGVFLLFLLSCLYVVASSYNAFIYFQF